MRRPLISICLTILPALFLNAHAGPPPQGGSCTAALNPRVAAAAAPAGNAAAAPLSAPGAAHGPYAYLLDASGNAVITVDLTGLSTLPIAATTAVGNGPATLALRPNGAILHIANW